MPALEDLAHVRDGVRRGEERAVEPATALANELWKRFWNVRLRDRALDIFEDPVVL